MSWLSSSIADDVYVHTNNVTNMLCLLLVSCPQLTDPNNGVINCSVGDDGVPSYEDTCSYTCNTDYQLNGSDVRTCQSDGSWSGIDATCSGK